MIGQWSGKSKIFLRLVWYLPTRARYFSFACLLFFLRNALPEGSLPFQRRNSVVLNTLWLQTQLTSLIFSWMNELSMPVMKREELNLTLFVYIVFYFVLFFSLFFSALYFFTPSLCSGLSQESWIFCGNFPEKRHPVIEAFYMEPLNWHLCSFVISAPVNYKNYHYILKRRIVLKARSDWQSAPDLRPKKMQSSQE